MYPRTSGIFCLLKLKICILIQIMVDFNLFYKIKDFNPHQNKVLHIYVQSVYQAYVQILLKFIIPNLIWTH